MSFARDRPMFVSCDLEICSHGQRQSALPYPDLDSAGICTTHLARIIICTGALEEAYFDTEIQHLAVDQLVEARRTGIVDLRERVCILVYNGGGVFTEVIQTQHLPHRVTLALPSQLPAHLAYFRQVLYRHVLKKMNVDIFRHSVKRQALAWRTRTHIAL